MFLKEAVKQTTDLDQSLKVLDLCAAPGGKTTLLASLINNESLLVANEVIRNRAKILEENVVKWGASNVVVTNQDPKYLSGLDEYFDMILVDAPCSGEGLFRKDSKALEKWSVNLVDLCAARQKRILANAVQLLKPGGTLIYSTCTYNDFENMDNVKWLCREFSMESLPLNTPSDWGIVEKKEKVGAGYQFYPHRLKGEGFFISCFRKKEGILPEWNYAKRNLMFPRLQKLHKKKKTLLRPWINNQENYSFWVNGKEEVFAIPKNLVEEIKWIQSQVSSILWEVFLIGTFKNTQFIPSHSLALHSQLLSDSLPRLELNHKQALAYLKKEYFPTELNNPGWLLFTYHNFPLGWVKVLHKRINNYYPKEWRIRMDI